MRSVRAVVAPVAFLAGLVACTSSGPSTDATSAAPHPSPTELTAPSGLGAATGYQPFQVTLTWTTPTEPADLSGWEVLRDTEQVGFVSPDITAYTDFEVEPGAGYVYAVLAAAGDRRSDAVNIAVKVPRPPLSEARFEGQYRMTGTATSSSGYTSFQDQPSFDWEVTATCGEGACDVRVKMFSAHTFRMRLDRRGGRYMGSATGQFAVKCGSVVMDSTVDVDVRVAAPIPPESFGTQARQWIARTLKGTLSQSEAPQSGCTGGSATFRISLASF